MSVYSLISLSLPSDDSTYHNIHVCVGRPKLLVRWYDKMAIEQGSIAVGPLTYIREVLGSK
jgi:hypothetical protein